LRTLNAASGESSLWGFTYSTVDRKGEWQSEQYDYIQENLLINHVAVGVPVGRMLAPFIGLGCDAFDFEATGNGGAPLNSADVTPAPIGLAANP